MDSIFTAEQTREIPCSKCGVGVDELCVDLDTGKVHKRKGGAIANHVERVKDRRNLAANKRIGQRRLTNTGQ